jgi:hypothetical protein
LIGLEEGVVVEGGVLVGGEEEEEEDMGGEVEDEVEGVEEGGGHMEINGKC